MKKFQQFKERFLERRNSKCENLFSNMELWSGNAACLRFIEILREPSALVILVLNYQAPSWSGWKICDMSVFMSLDSNSNLK